MVFYPDPIDQLREHGLVSKTYPYAEASSPRDRQRTADARRRDDHDPFSSPSRSNVEGTDTKDVGEGTTRGGVERSSRATRDDRLSMAEVGLVNKRAQMNATVTGLVSAVAIGFAVRRSMRMTPNASVLIAIVSGSFIAYLEARTELSRGMTALAYSHEMRTGKRPFGLSAPENPELLKEQTSWNA